MTDSYSEVSTESWISRIGGSILGVGFGLLLFLVAFVLLWWNEGRSIETYKSLKEGQKDALSIPIQPINQGNNGKLVYIQGPVLARDQLIDPDFSVAMSAIKLKRRVQMYQWIQTEKSNTVTNVGGGTTTTKSYTYHLDWTEAENDSRQYKEAVGHSNPAMPFKSQEFVARNVSLGDFSLNGSQIERMSDYQPLTVPVISLPKVMARRKITKTGHEFYVGENPFVPVVGDLKLNYEVVMPGQVSVVARQASNGFDPYVTKTGGTVDLFENGIKTLGEMFAIAQDENTVLTWILRGAGFALFWIALYLMLNPLVMISELVPLVGQLIAAGAGLFSLLAAIPLTLSTIATAWIIARPLLALSVLVAAGVSVSLIFLLPRQRPNQG